MGEAALATQNDSAPAKRRPGQRGKALTGPEVGDILRWDREGLTQQQIATRFDPPKSQSAISDCLARYGTDRTDDAKAILRASAPSMALNIVKRGQPRDHVAALKGLNVLEESQQHGLVIQIGGGAGDVKVAVLVGAFAPPIAEAKRNSAETLTIEAGSDKSRYVNAIVP